MAGKEIIMDMDRVLCLANELTRLTEREDYERVIMTVTDNEIFFKPIASEIKIVIKKQAG